MPATKPKQWILHSLSKLIENIWKKFSNIILLGDFNTNLLQDERGDTSYEGNKMKGIGEQFNMKNVVEGLTRITNHSKTLIDLIVTNIKDPVKQKGRMSPGYLRSRHDLWKGYRPEVRGYVIYSPRALPEGINHITPRFRPIIGLFSHWRGFLKGCKNTLTKNASIIFLLFFNTPCWHWWHSQVSRLFNYVSFSKSHFKLVVRSEC